MDVDGTRREGEPFALVLGVDVLRIVEAWERTEEMDAAEDFGRGVGVGGSSTTMPRGKAMDDRGVLVLDELVVTDSGLAGDASSDMLIEE